MTKSPVTNTNIKYSLRDKRISRTEFTRIPLSRMKNPEKGSKFDKIFMKYRARKQGMTKKSSQRNNQDSLKKKDFATAHKHVGGLRPKPMRTQKKKYMSGLDSNSIGIYERVSLNDLTNRKNSDPKKEKKKRRVLDVANQETRVNPKNFENKHKKMLGKINRNQRINEETSKELILSKVKRDTNISGKVIMEHSLIKNDLRKPKILFQKVSSKKLLADKIQQLNTKMLQSEKMKKMETMTVTTRYSSHAELEVEAPDRKSRVIKLSNLQKNIIILEGKFYISHYYKKIIKLF